MAGLVQLKDLFDIAFGNDPDADRHGIVTPSLGLLNPNHYLAVAIRYLLTNRPKWPLTAVVGKTLVSSCLLDRVVASAGCDWRILVISHPLCLNIKVQWRQTGTNHHSTDSQT